MKVSPLLLLPVLLAYSSPLLAQPACVKPDVGALFKTYAAREHPKQYDGVTGKKTAFSAADIDGYADILDQTSSFAPYLQTDGPSVQWSGLAWDRLIDGGLLAADCKGRYIGLLRIGPVVELKKGPTLPEIGTTVMVISEVAPGTGVDEHDLYIIGLVKNRLEPLWKHALQNSVFTSGLGKAEDYQANLSADGLTIELKGTIKSYAAATDEDPPTKVVSVRATYCWDAKRSKYLDCSKR